MALAALALVVFGAYDSYPNFEVRSPLSLFVDKCRLNYIRFNKVTSPGLCVRVPIGRIGDVP